MQPKSEWLTLSCQASRSRQRSITRSSLPVAINVEPLHHAISRGRPTLTETSRAIPILLVQSATTPQAGATAGGAHPSQIGLRRCDRESYYRGPCQEGAVPRAGLFNLYSTMAVHNLSRADIVVSETILVEALWLYCVRSGHRCIDRK